MKPLRHRCVFLSSNSPAGMDIQNLTYYTPTKKEKKKKENQTRCTCSRACNMCQDELRMISSDLCKARQNLLHLHNNENAPTTNKFQLFFFFLLFTCLIWRHSTCGGEAFREAKQEEDGLIITAGLSRQFLVFNNGQLKKDQWVVPSVLVACHQCTSQWPTVNSTSAPDGKAALEFRNLAN